MREIITKNVSVLVFDRIFNDLIIKESHKLIWFMNIIEGLLIFTNVLDNIKRA